MQKTKGIGSVYQPVQGPPALDLIIALEIHGPSKPRGLGALHGATAWPWATTLVPPPPLNILPTKTMAYIIIIRKYLLVAGDAADLCFVCALLCVE